MQLDGSTRPALTDTGQFDKPRYHLVRRRQLEDNISRTCFLGFPHYRLAFRTQLPNPASQSGPLSAPGAPHPDPLIRRHRQRSRVSRSGMMIVVMDTIIWFV